MAISRFSNRMLANRTYIPMSIGVEYLPTSVGHRGNVLLLYKAGLKLQSGSSTVKRIGKICLTVNNYVTVKL